MRTHPVRAMVQELMVHGYGAELALEEWSEAGVAAYLAQRGAGAEVPAALARVLTQRTDGHPLFVVALVDELLRQRVLRVESAGWVVAGGLDSVTVGVPPSIRHLLEHQVARLRPADQELLAAASVAGVEFAVAAVAAGVQHTGEDVEVQCDTLARQHQLVQARGTALWPDGTVTARYGFRHALYQELIYEQVPVSRRVRWHQQIGTRLEAAFGPCADESRPNWRCTLSKDATTTGPCSICGTRRRLLCSVTPIVRRLHTCGGRWRCCRPWRKRHSGFGTNSRCSWPSAPRSWSPGVLPPPRSPTPMPEHASCVSNWAITNSSFRPSLGCGGLRTSGGSYGRRGRSGNSSSAWPTPRMILSCSWKRRGHWDKRSACRAS